MATLIFSMGVSLDGYIADAAGGIDWNTPGPELAEFHVLQTRELTADLSGRGLYEEMLPWESRDGEFAELWQAIPKVVFSTTLGHVDGNARLASAPIEVEVGALRDEPGGLISVGGAGLAAQLVERDLIDEYRLFVNPVVLGGGTPYFPSGRRLELSLVETQTFDGRVVYQRWRRAREAS